MSEKIHLTPAEQMMNLLDAMESQEDMRDAAMRLFTNARFHIILLNGIKSKGDEETNAIITALLSQLEQAMKGGAK